MKEETIKQKVKPKGKSIEKVREIRDVMEARVKELVSNLIQDSQQAYI